jgi:hypothetical protein
LNAKIANGHQYDDLIASLCDGILFSLLAKTHCRAIIQATRAVVRVFEVHKAKIFDQVKPLKMRFTEHPKDLCLLREQLARGGVSPLLMPSFR